MDKSNRGIGVKLQDVPCMHGVDACIHIAIQ